MAKNKKFKNCDISTKYKPFLKNSGICLSLINNYDLFNDKSINVECHLL